MDDNEVPRSGRNWQQQKHRQQQPRQRRWESCKVALQQEKEKGQGNKTHSLVSKAKYETVMERHKLQKPQ